MKIPGKKKGMGMRRNMLQLHIDTEDKLYASYLPFLKNGGLFIPTDKIYKLGDEVFVLLTLLTDGEKAPVSGKVVWINPKNVGGGRPAGIGMHIGDMDKGVTREKIEKLIANRLKSDKKTYTI